MHQKILRNLAKTILWAVFALAVAAGSVRLFHAADLDSSDFHVYWRAVHDWFQGVSPYRILPDDRGFVFKYPPWLLPFLIPLKFWAFQFSKGTWAAGELLCLIYCGRWLVRHGTSPKVTWVGIFLFWYLWLAHFYSGQVTIFLLAASLWAVEGAAEGAAQETRHGARASLLFVLFSTKVFSLFSLIGIWRRWANPRGVAMILMIFAVLHAVVAAFATPSLTELYRAWITAAGSGNTELGYEVVRGTGNHGLVAGILRWVDPYARHLNFDLAVSLLLAAVLGIVWSKASRRLKFEEKWAGWLAYGVIIHPLAWHHSFVLAFPLCVLTLQATTELPKSIRPKWIFLTVFSISLITLLVPQVVGKELVKPPELLANKSWGVLLCSWILTRARKLRPS